MSILSVCTPPSLSSAPSLTGLASLLNPSTLIANTETNLEYTAICSSFGGFLPSSFILEIQSILRSFGIKPSATEIMAIPYIIPAILFGIFTFTLGFCRKHIKIVLTVIVILALIYYVMNYTKKESFANADPPSVNQGPSAVSAAPTGDQYTLINIQPVGVKQVAYIGPQIPQGLFDPVNGIINVMTGGVRFLTLQIDYLDNKLDSSKFDDPGIPTLLYRNNAGTMMSANGAAISDIAKNIVNYSFNPQFATSQQPLIIYLHFVRTPDYIRAPDKYMKFLSAVATALAPIRPMIAQGTGSTLFGRQQNEKILLYTPLQSFENKILVMCNLDTTIFRNAAQMGLSSVPLAQDLDSMVHMRVYLENEADSLGATTAAAESTPYAVILPYSRLSTMTVKQRTQIANKGKTRFTIAMPDQMSDPSQDKIADLFTSTGVNVIPVNMFGKTYQDIKGNLTSWGTTPFYNIKPVALQSAQIATTPYGGPAFSPAAISPV